MQLRRIVAVCAFGLLATGIAASAAEQKRPIAKNIVYSGKLAPALTEEQRKLLLLFAQSRRVLFTESTTCVPQPGGVCVIEVPVYLLSDANGTYCVARFPEKYSIPGTPGSTEKTIVWSLLPPADAPANATFTFFEGKISNKALGIIVIKDGNTQLHDGALGDGTTPTDAKRFLIKNKHKIKGESVYIPIVVRKDDAGTSAEKVSVCGTPDPTIAND